MMPSSPPEITLEINSGSLTIRTAEAIYHVLVVGAIGAQSAAATAALPIAERPLLTPLPTAPSGLDQQIKSAEGAPEDEAYYRELTNDMYMEVGRLARRLSMSIRDVSIDKMDGLDLDSAGDRLESAKDELENVVKMTEQATLKIMDLTEGIQASVDKTKKIMKQLDVDAGVTEPTNDAADNASANLNSFLQALAAKPLTGCLSQAGQLVEILQNSPAPVQPAAATPPAGQAYEFPLDLVFQTMYELCTNEAVKKHIKAMWDSAAQTFDQIKLEAGLNQVAAAGGGPDQDNFLNLNLKDVLKAMFQATIKENFQQILKKMASTAEQIFLEASLPLEAMPKADAPASASVSAEPSAADNPALPLAWALLNELQTQAAALAPPPLSELAPLGSTDSAQISPQFIEQLQASMGEIFSYVNGIVETLSFQDLAGQTIYKTVKMLTDFQVQILALLVGFGSKIKTKEKAPQDKVNSAQSNAMAQVEVDKALAAVGIKETDGETVGKLNQNSINDLLGSLGF